MISVEVHRLEVADPIPSRPKRESLNLPRRGRENLCNLRRPLGVTFFRPSENDSP